ncbi:bactofilin family protein [Haladaptatus sp.]|uniref:bactofilin family protein n=1 Tax=Haladaptatus sp. TaxID=1973141 RepID=UPI003C6442F9
MCALVTRRRLVPIIVLVLLLAIAPATAAAEQTRTGGTVVVGQGQTVSGGLSATAGTVVIRGTVNGNLEAFSGNVLVAQTGTVNGDVSAFAGNVRIEGTVNGNVDAQTGNLVVAKSATVGQSLEGASGYTLIAGTVNGDAQVAGDTLTLANSANVGGNLVYDVNKFNRQNGATVGGTVRQDESLTDAGPSPIPKIPGWVGAVYGFFVNLLLGIVLLALFPMFSDSVADNGRTNPLFSIGVGILFLVLVPIVLLVFAITVIGIPISILGAIVFAIFLWIATVYGSLTVGVWLLSLADSGGHWLGLILGLFVVAILSRIPVVGGIFTFVVLLLGLGALAAALWSRYRGRRNTPEYMEAPTGGDEETPAD